ncbi:DUF2892 domain-containing protein [Alicyclobacillaceae bacterium I2511]|nr:DUF2892 domain-containing protein [Alicyclobacillaceae bacterium I2511]
MKNVGVLDRILRIFIGLVLLSVLIFAHGSVRYIGLIGLVPLLTAAIGVCPLYRLFGIRTCPLRDHS